MQLSSSLTIPILITTFILLSITAESIVPPSKTFKYINQGSFGEYSVEYAADYRALDISRFPFVLCFYNTTPNAFILGLRMGHRRSESVMRWVWDANRSNPVRENATLTFGRDGNLVLADVNGRIAWQTNTANKGVVGLDLLPSGNLALYDKKGRFIWQSFDHPTDTLLVGQAVRSIGPNRLVSRLSKTEPFDGPYSFIMDKGSWALNYKVKNSLNPLVYYKSEDLGDGIGLLANLDFYCSPETDQGYAFELGFMYNMTNSSSMGTRILSRPKYNCTYSMLRLDIDGNLKIYTYNENVDWGAWEVTYALFGYDENESQCSLPRKCGRLGVCEENQCVACPKPWGLAGWSKDCAPPTLPPCRGGGVATGVAYYKVVGVEHFSSEYAEGDGPITVGDCKNRCSKDCGCLGFFYKEESSKCLLVPELGALIKVSNLSHVAYIKMSK